MTRLRALGLRLTKWPLAVAALVVVVAIAGLIWYRWPLSVTVAVDGQTSPHQLHRGTVAIALQRLGISVGANDRVEPAVTARLVDGMTVNVIRVSTRTVTEQQVIAHPVVRRDDPGLSQGITERIQAGADGSERVTYSEVYENGALVRRDVVDRQVARDAKPELIAVGTGRSITVSRGGVDYRSRRVLRVVATAYDPSVGSTTRTGTTPKRGTVAVDPRVIPLGSRLYIDGYGYGVAEDTGGAIKGNRIDVWLPTQAEALAYGRQTVTVYVLERVH